MYFDPFKNSPLFKMIEQHQKWAEIANQQQKIIDSVQPVIQLQKRIDEILKPFKEAQKINETLSKIAKGFIETEEDIKTFKAAIVELGYPPHDTIDIPLLRRIASDYRKMEKSMCKSILMSLWLLFMIKRQ